jgi:hypothetical protein
MSAFHSWKEAGRAVPVHSPHTIKAGTTSKLLLMYARDGRAGQEGRTGLGAETPGAAAAYVREGEGASRMDLVAGEVGRWAPGGFAEVDPDLVPGVYQLGLPDEAVAPGSTHVLVVVRFPDAVVDPVDIELVAYDPQDELCIGMAQLQDRKRHEFLRRALPRMTEQELALGADVEGQLTARIEGEGR